MGDDPFDLERFVAAQDAGATYAAAVAELRAGRKRSHWMWFVFPQLSGLGRSAMARRYAISSAEEAAAYLRHPVLGPRLREVAGIVAATPGAASAEDVFGGIDAVKLRSSMTLFLAVAAPPDDELFRSVLERFFAGVADAATSTRLSGA